VIRPVLVEKRSVTDVIELHMDEVPFSPIQSDAPSAKETTARASNTLWTKSTFLGRSVARKRTCRQKMHFMKQNRKTLIRGLALGQWQGW
jgi:hypothetical protein